MANKMMGDRLRNKLNNLNTEIKNLKSLATFQSAIFSNDNNEDQEFMKQFPIFSQQTLEFCENILKKMTELKTNWYSVILLCCYPT